MSTKKLNRQGSGPSQTSIANHSYKQKIYTLCRRIQKGDKAAEESLNIELKTNLLAYWSVKHWLKLQSHKNKKTRKTSSKDGLPLSRAKGMNHKRRGNAFKPYQEGIPGLGKNR
ncbi:hypothetical protein SAMN05216361_3621 [Marisediminitalea aggregata]|uniref:Uncharacterized protein n=1 Tax=Marisediminitalea aggregata TaxID=634436 RepID=A0A1M5PWJ7_9ALTE|nr:hypothetical protein [Marisediminitalea aggregata]SHH05849.1 hypothetical protein SAMN05216361_3621 [Marisediminitalea aggregata]